MKTTIPCKITHSETDQCWHVEAPSFYDGFITNGTTLENAKELAAGAISKLLETHLKNNFLFPIPPPNEEPDYFPIPLEPGLAFALWLRNKRKSNNMSIADVAQELGMKSHAYQRLENPRTANPSLKILCKIEQIFGQELVTL